MAPIYKESTRRERRVFMNTDAESRVGRLHADFHTKLEEIDMTDLTVVEPKACVKLLVAAIRPTGLRPLIERESQQEDYSKLKKYVIHFTHWLRKHVEHYLPYVGLVVRSEAAAPVADDTSKKDWKNKRSGGCEA